MQKTQCTIQLGKQGITENFICSLKNRFKTHRNVKICVLKSARHDKRKLKEFSEKILEELGTKYTAKTIGFTIFVKGWRKVRK